MLSPAGHSVAGRAHRAASVSPVLGAYLLGGDAAGVLATLHTGLDPARVTETEPVTRTSRVPPRAAKHLVHPRV